MVESLKECNINNRSPFLYKNLEFILVSLLRGIIFPMWKTTIKTCRHK